MSVARRAGFMLTTEHVSVLDTFTYQGPQTNTRLTVFMIESLHQIRGAAKILTVADIKIKIIDCLSRWRPRQEPFYKPT